jgi:hypothetical protein
MFVANRPKIVSIDLGEEEAKPNSQLWNRNDLNLKLLKSIGPKINSVVAYG